METSLHSAGLWVSSCLSQVSLKYWDFGEKNNFTFLLHMVLLVFKAQQFPKDLKSMCQRTIITFDAIVSNGLIIYCTAVLSGAWKLKVRQIHLSLIKYPERGVERGPNTS